MGLRKYRKNETNFYDKGFEELYKINTLISVTQNTCKDLEFKGQYYGISQSKANQLSIERNKYITMLDLALDMLADFTKIYLAQEPLHQNSDYCCR